MPVPLCRAQCRGQPGLRGLFVEAFMDLEKPFQSQTILIKIQDKPLVHLGSICFLQS